MTGLLDRIEKYWDGRVDGYSEVNLAELNSLKKQTWLELIYEQVPKARTNSLRVLDVGTGPGFFAISLAERGHQVTAVDYTQAMLDRARENAGAQADNIEFRRMDAHYLEFAEESFDLVISRNLTWTLQEPSKAYQSWHRVLAKGGCLLNFDANWYLHVHDEDKRREYEQDRLNTELTGLADHYTCTDTDAMERIAADLPLSRLVRPQWDAQVLLDIGFENLFMDRSVGQRVWDKEELVNYHSTPLFMIGAKK